MRHTLSFLLAATLLALPGRAQSSVIDVARVGAPSVVTVMMFFESTGFSGKTRTRVQRPGSGVLLSSDGLVVTNEHLIAEVLGPRKDEYWLTIGVGFFEYDAEIIARDERLDLVLLKLNTDRRHSPLPLAHDVTSLPGEKVVAIGAPNKGQKVTFAGSLAFPSGQVQLRDALLEASEVLMTDSRFHETVDGGPLLDARGRVLGIHNSFHIQPQFLRNGDEKEGERMKPPPSTDYDMIVSASAIQAAFGEHLKDAAPSVPLGEADASEASAAIAAIAPSVVSVWGGPLVDHPKTPDPADPQAQRIAKTHGSGVIVDPAGLVLTNGSLFEGENTEGSVRLADGRVFPARLIQRDKNQRATLLALELPEGTVLPAATLADSTASMAGEFAAVVGRPYSNDVTMSVGVLSSLERVGLVQVASWVHPGHLGGALVDRSGRLIGIATKQPEDTQRANEDSYLGFAVPIAEIRASLGDEWKAHSSTGEAGQPVAYTDEETAARTNPTAVVTEMTKGSLINVLVKAAIPQDETGFDPFASSEREFRLISQGSGVVIHSSGLAISNWHVVDGAMNDDGSQSDEFQIEVTLPDGRSYIADVLSTSRDDDLSLLALQLDPGEELVPIELGDSDSIQVGTAVIAIGNPLGLANSVSSGVISAKDHDTMIQGRLRTYEGMLMTDAAINPGNSGGALLDQKGRLIGINSAGSVGVGLAIPVERARSVFSDKLLSTEKTRSVYLGMEVSEDTDGLVVDRIDSGGPAELVGLEVGDRILQISGQDVKTAVIFARLRMDAQAGTPLTLQVKREAGPETVELMPLSFDAWHAWRQCGIEVAEVDYSTESALVQEACIALHREYIGDAAALPSQLMSGALRVTRARDLDDKHSQSVEVGDLVLGMTVFTATTADIYEQLVRFESIDDMKAQFDVLATKEGSEATCWLLRDGKIMSTKVFFRRPPRKI
jgi:S1-C subfamily serine protease